MYGCEKAYPGVSGEWATSDGGTRVGEWIEFTYSPPVAILNFVYKNRAVETQSNKKVKITFSDGSEEEVDLNVGVTKTRMAKSGISSARIEVLEVYHEVHNGGKVWFETGKLLYKANSKLNRWLKHQSTLSKKFLHKIN